jgi:hypothetical protein
MTNEQLKILLESQVVLLEKAIEEAVELMPENADREMEWNYIGKEKGIELAATHFSIAGYGPENHPDYEEQPTGRYSALIPLYEYLELLKRQITELCEMNMCGPVNI